MGFEQIAGPVSLAPTIREKDNRGRPNLLDNSPEIREAIIEYVAEGLGFGEACSLAGVSRQTLYNYMQTGAKNIRAGNYEQENSNFYLQIKKAEAEAELNHIQNITSAARIPAFWAASAWMLERKYPDKYGKQDRLTVNSTSKIDVTQVNVQENIIDANSREIVNAFARLTIPSESEGVDSASGVTGVLDDDGEIPIP